MFPPRRRHLPRRRPAASSARPRALAATPKDATPQRDSTTKVSSLAFNRHACPRTLSCVFAASDSVSTCRPLGSVSDVRVNRAGPVKFSDCQAKCNELGERCDALDVNGAEGCGSSGVCGWCGVWGNLSAADTDGLFLYYAGPGGRACQGVPAQGGGNTCYRRPPFCTAEAGAGAGA